MRYYYRKGLFFKIIEGFYMMGIIWIQGIGRIWASWHRIQFDRTLQGLYLCHPNVLEGTTSAGFPLFRLDFWF